MALASFAAIEAELADDIGAGRMRELRRTLLDLVAATSPRRHDVERPTGHVLAFAVRVGALDA